MKALQSVSNSAAPAVQPQGFTPLSGTLFTRDSYLDYNRLNGGIARHYEPVATDVVEGATMASILNFCRDLFDRLMPATSWHIEVHQFRIEANAGESGLPTPEGNHRDGVNFVLVMMVKRSLLIGMCWW